MERPLTRGHDWGRLARGAASLACAVLAIAAVAPAAQADASQSFTAPGSYDPVAPPNAYLVDITVAGASGTSPPVGFNPNPGGAGGLGSTMGAQASVFPGEEFNVIVGAAGGAGRGAAQPGIT